MLTIPEFRAGLRLPIEEDEGLVALLADVVGLWESETGRPWNRRVGHVEVFEPVHAPGRDLLLALSPVETVTQVRTLSRGDSTWVVMASSDYLKVGLRTLKRVSTEWPRETAIEVTYTGGYADAPADVKRALVTQAAFMRDRLASEKLVTQSQNFEGGAGVFLKADLHPLFEAAAKRHARRA